MPIVRLGFGGNLGDPMTTIERAVAALGQRGVALTRWSRLYRTPAWGPVAQPDFINSCAEGETALAPRALLAAAQAVEAELGRERSMRWGPRTIDIDILGYGDTPVDEPDLVIPHARLTERAFVLVPLTEIAPDWVVRGRRVRDWAAASDRKGVEPLRGGLAPTVRTST